METMNFKEAIAEISNRKKHDKHSICYMLSGMNVHGFYDPEFHKRAELIEKFITIGFDNYHKISHFRCFKKNNKIFCSLLTILTLFLRSEMINFFEY